MNAKRATKGTDGFTLIELLMCMAIISVLSAIVYVSLGPARAKGREARCINNLRQIGMAMSMYRQDYGGGDPPETLTAEKLGLPSASRGAPSLITALLPYTGSRDVFHCSDVYDPGAPPLPATLKANVCDYLGTLYLGEEKIASHIPRYSEIVARYGEDTPLLIDVYHGMRTRRPHLTRANTSSVLILQLNGEVHRRLVRDDRFEWDWQGGGE